MHAHVPNAYETSYRRAAARNQRGGLLITLGGIVIILGATGGGPIVCLLGALFLIPGIRCWADSRIEVETYEREHDRTPRF